MSYIFALRTTANREDQVMDFVYSHAQKKNLKILSLIRPHDLRGYIFIEAESKVDAESAFKGVPYARGLLPKPLDFKEIEHMFEKRKSKNYKNRHGKRRSCC